MVGADEVGVVIFLGFRVGDGSISGCERSGGFSRGDFEAIQNHFDELVLVQGKPWDFRGPVTTQPKSKEVLGVSGCGGLEVVDDLLLEFVSEYFVA